MVDPRGLATQIRSAWAACSSTRIASSSWTGTVRAATGWSRRCSQPPSSGSEHYVEQPDLRMPARRRLAFRELGLAIGLAALEGDAWRGAAHSVRARVDQLSRYLPLRAEIDAFWLQPEHRRADSWLEHANINEVMLATSLRPEGFLVLPPVCAR